MQAKADAADEREPPARAAHELAEVVPGDVLDHLAARVHDRAVGEDERDAEHEVARGAEAVSQRAGEVLREAGTDRRIAGRVEREALTRRGERSRELREADARLDRAGEVAGLVLEDAIHARRRRDRHRSRPYVPRTPAAESAAEACSRLETLGKADQLQRVLAVGARDLAAEPRRRDHLARVGDPVRVEGTPQPLERLEIAL